MRGAGFLLALDSGTLDSDAEIRSRNLARLLTFVIPAD
jgi:hypothetical protein